MLPGRLGRRRSSPPLDEAGLHEAAEAVASFDGLLLVHAEDPGSLRPAPEGNDYAGFAESRPPEAEVVAIEAVVAAARATGCRMHVVHLAAAAALPVVRAAQDAGVPVTAETCPHYLTLTASDAPDGDAAFKCCPPLRDDDNRDGLWAGLRDGTIGMVVSDHSPCPAELKATGRRSGRRLGRRQLAPARDWPPPGPRPGGAGTGCPTWCAGWPPRPADLAGLRTQGPDRRGRRRGPVRARARRVVRRRPGAPRAPAPGHAVRRTDAHRRRPPDLAGRAPGRPGRAATRAAARPRRATMSHDFTDQPDLASRALGAGVVYANDDLFAARENLVTPGPPVHDPTAFGPRGKLYDGWETRRRRTPGNDVAIVRLGVRGAVSGVVVDTAYFVGNYPPRVSVDGVDLAGYPSADELLGASWQPLVPVSEVEGRRDQRVRRRRGRRPART